MYAAQGNSAHKPHLRPRLQPGKTSQTSLGTASSVRRSIPVHTARLADSISPARQLSDAAAPSRAGATRRGAGRGAHCKSRRISGDSDGDGGALLQLLGHSPRVHARHHQVSAACRRKHITSSSACVIGARCPGRNCTPPCKGLTGQGALFRHLANLWRVIRDRYIAFEGMSPSTVIIQCTTWAQMR